MAIEAAKKPHFVVVVVDEQQLLGTEPESVLIEGLIGIQGRGRSTSPQQLKEVERAVRVLKDLQGEPDPVGAFMQIKMKMVQFDIGKLVMGMPYFGPSSFSGLAAEQQGRSADVIKKTFQATEEGFFSLVSKQWPTKPQIVAVGSCCLVSVRCGGTLYIANVGDSHAVFA
ncbi:probable protein phosphatase 2C 28 isoform X1 [Aristolochia californica]|uniref:probable protein phosphatase 2C 28 isoform X1 n=1 Tax=Aristolochia californica TaxID=171875 RepID=UPI0035DC7B43